MKAKLFTLILVATLLLTACGSKYNVDTSNMPKAQRDNEEQLLDRFLQEYETVKMNETATAEAKADAAFEVGFRYMVLGKNDKAMKYYEEVLTYDPKHLKALTNLVSIYENAGEVVEALNYQQQLYYAYPTMTKIVADTIRLLLKNGQINEATGLINTFKRSEDAEGKEEFINSQFTLIRNAIDGKPIN